MKALNILWNIPFEKSQGDVASVGQAAWSERWPLGAVPPAARPASPAVLRASGTALRYSGFRHGSFYISTLCVAGVHLCC